MREEPQERQVTQSRACRYFMPNCAVKPTRLRRAAYFHSLRFFWSLHESHWGS
ncbi:DUF1010 domain-containing protein [Melaminivora jejuensis]|uniref:DUF1010 domain-containing protein n=1 Tax=Melaminivora jejuensis TaxID=1267217 RepID=UPI0038CBFA48